MSRQPEKKVLNLSRVIFLAVSFAIPLLSIQDVCADVEQDVQHLLNYIARTKEAVSQMNGRPPFCLTELPAPGAVPEPSPYDSKGNTVLHLLVLDQEKRGILKDPRLRGALSSNKNILDLKNKKGETALLLAVKKGDIEAVEVLLQAGANPFLVGPEGESAFTLAKKKKNGEILDKIEKRAGEVEIQQLAVADRFEVRKILKRRDLWSIPKKELKPDQERARNKHICKSFEYREHEARGDKLADIEFRLKQFKDIGIDLNDVFCDEKSLLNYVIDKGFIELIPWLMENGVHVSLPERAVYSNSWGDVQLGNELAHKEAWRKLCWDFPENGLTILRYLSGNGKADLAKQILKHVIEFNPYYFHPLVSLALAKDPALLKELLPERVTLVRNGWQQTEPLLHYAVEIDDPKFVELAAQWAVDAQLERKEDSPLKEVFTSTNLNDAQKAKIINTVLDAIQRWKGPEEYLKFLNQGIPLGKGCKSGQTCNLLAYAAAFGPTQVARRLVREGADQQEALKGIWALETQQPTALAKRILSFWEPKNIKPNPLLVESLKSIPLDRAKEWIANDLVAGNNSQQDLISTLLKIDRPFLQQVLPDSVMTQGGKYSLLLYLLSKRPQIADVAAEKLIKSGQRMEWPNLFADEEKWFSRALLQLKPENLKKILPDSVNVKGQEVPLLFYSIGNGLDISKVALEKLIESGKPIEWPRTWDLTIEDLEQLHHLLDGLKSEDKLKAENLITMPDTPVYRYLSQGGFKKVFKEERFKHPPQAVAYYRSDAILEYWEIEYGRLKNKKNEIEDFESYEGQKAQVDSLEKQMKSLEALKEQIPFMQKLKNEIEQLKNQKTEIETTNAQSSERKVKELEGHIEEREAKIRSMENQKSWKRFMESMAKRKARDDAMKKHEIQMMELISSLNIPNTLKGRKREEEGKGISIEMPYYPTTLQDILSGLQPGQHLLPNATFNLAARLCKAIVKLHTAGIVHRDIKPANILLDQSGNPVLGDYGLAYQKEKVEINEEYFKYNTIGTPGYIWVEDRSSLKDAFKRFEVEKESDWFAFGITMIKSIRGKSSLPLKNLLMGFNPPEARDALINLLNCPSPKKKEVIQNCEDENTKACEVLQSSFPPGP